MTRAVGLAVALVKGRPRADVVVMEGTRSAPVLVESFALTSGETELVDQLHDLATALRNRLIGLKPDRVMIRRADQAPTPSGAEGPKVRLLTEGALAMAARERCVDTRLLSGMLVAKRAGTKKDALDSTASGMVGPKGPTEAAAAALAVLDP